VIAGIVLSGCAHVPTVPETVATDTGQQISEISVRDTRGRLSLRETTALLKRLEAQAPDADALQRHLVVEQAVSGRPLYSGNHVVPLHDGPDTFAATFAAIHEAKHFLYLEYYILEDVQCNGERLSDLLIARAQQGVQIDVMYDALGSLSTPAEFFDRLRAAGVRVRKFNAFNALSPYSSLNSRDHRKILVADGEAAIIGGVNLSTDYQSLGSGQSTPLADPPPAHGAAAEPWHDTDLQLEGPVVRELSRLFAQHWTAQGGTVAELAMDAVQVPPRGDQIVRVIGSEQEHGRMVPRYYATLLAGIRSASNRIWVTAAYFVPTHEEREALELAARRGIDVRLLLPSHSDSAPALAVQQSYYSGLLHAGVKIFERQDGILHSKTIVTDSVWSLVGSSNFDHRSVLFNDEVDAVVIGRQTGAQLEQTFLDGQAHARQIEAADWRARSFGHRVHERWWRLWEQWL
jgi:cardiolipin synthase